MRGRATRHRVAQQHAFLKAARTARMVDTAAARLLQSVYRRRQAIEVGLKRVAAARTLTRWGKAMVRLRQARQWRHAEMRAQSNAAARVQTKYRAARGRLLPGYSGGLDALGAPLPAAPLQAHLAPLSL